MIELSLGTIARGQDGLLAMFVVFLRVGATMALLPAFGERSIPERIRLLLAVGFSVIVFPAVFETVHEVTEVKNAIFRLLLSEAISGLAIGFFIRLFVMSLQVAGSIIAQSTSLSQLFGGAGVDPQPAVGHLLSVSGLALAVSAGLHIKVAEILIYSYEILPAGKFPSPNIFMDLGVQEVSRAFALAFTLAAPFVVASLIYNVALGVINRAMPQLMVSFVGAPAITAGGLALLFISAPILLVIWQNALNSFLANPMALYP